MSTPALTSPRPRGGFDPQMIALWVKKFREFVKWDTPTPAMYPDELNVVLEYHDRVSRCSVSPTEGEAGKANVCFLVKTYAGQRELYHVDTETKEINRLAFFAAYKGKPEIHPNMEIGQY